MFYNWTQIVYTFYWLGQVSQVLIVYLRIILVSDIVLNISNGAYLDIYCKDDTWIIANINYSVCDGPADRGSITLVKRCKMRVKVLSLLDQERWCPY